MASFDSGANRPGRAARAAHVSTEVKGSLIRGLALALKDTNLFETVVEHVDPPTRDLLLAPPPSSTWTPGQVTLEIHDVIYDLRGERVLQDVARQAVRRGVTPLLATVIESSLRLFGVSPATLFSKLQTLSSSTTRGMFYTYAALSPRSGRVTVRYLNGKGVPISAFWSAVGGLSVVFDHCGVSGECEAPRYEDPPVQSTASFAVRWETGVRAHTSPTHERMR